MELLGVVGVGFLLGLRHATDADHVVAVTTIVAQEPSVLSAARIGGLWGVGHTLSLLAFGGAIIGFQLVLPPRLGLSLEMLVAVMLLGLGAYNVRSGLQGATPPEGHAGRPHAHRSRRPLLIGTVHGLAGSAAVALLVLSTIANPWEAVAYLLVFGLGTVAGMMLVTTALATPTLWFGAQMGNWERRLRVAAGVVSLVFGALLARELIVDGGLFSAVPSWEPH